jgi:hypothetical protein
MIEIFYGWWCVLEKGNKCWIMFEIVYECWCVLENGSKFWLMFDVVYGCWLMLEQGMSAGGCSKKRLYVLDHV